MRPPLDGATILLTGASAGIGWAMAHELAPKAKTLILVARRAERLEELQQELRSFERLEVRVEPCDLTDLQQTADLLDRLEREVGVIDVLINNAGFGDIGVFEFADWDKLHRMLQLNIAALTFLTHRLIGPMRAQGKGGVLNISSGAGLIFIPGFSVYAATKNYVTSFTEALRCELAGTGVVVSQVCPGPVATEFEQVAENPTDLSVPGFIEISAKQCASSSIRGFARGKALITPGFLSSVLIGLSRLVPRSLYRLFFGLNSKLLYAKSLPKRSSKAE